MLQCSGEDVGIGQQGPGVQLQIAEVEQAALGFQLLVFNPQSQAFDAPGNIDGGGYQSLKKAKKKELAQAQGRAQELEEQTLEEAMEDEKQIPVDICNHALLVGFGRVGSLLGEKLMAQGIPLVVIETSRTRVDELRERNIQAVLGNAANEETMHLAHLECARWLLLTIPNGYEAGEIVASARAKCPHIEIIEIGRAHV